MAESKDERYDRQLRLAEIGSSGQARIEAHEARVAQGPAAGVALSYLVRAGMGRLRIERHMPAPAFPHGGMFQFSGPHAVAAGAHAALAEIKQALSGTREREDAP